MKPKLEKVVSSLIGVSPTVSFKVHNANYANLARGIYERLFYVSGPHGFERPPQPTAGVYHARLARSAEALLSRISKSNPIPREAFPGLYLARRRILYQKAVDSLVYACVTRVDAIVKTFTKAEKVNFSAKSDPAPRIIQPRDPRYNVEVGKFIKPLEHRLVKAVAKLFDSPTIMKGLNSVQIGNIVERKWNRFCSPVAVSFDAKRFDQHVSTQALEFEHSIYVRCFASETDRKELARLLSWQLVNHGKAFVDGMKVRYAVNGARMSGDMNTGIGNCLLMCIMFHAFLAEHGIVAELINNGDDCTLILDQSQLHLLDFAGPWFLEMGFQMEVEQPVFELEHIRFCQSCFLFDGIGYRMVRDPATSVAKDSFSLVPFTTPRIMRAWMGSLGDGGLALNSGIPVMQAFHRMYKRESHGHVMGDHPALETGSRLLSKGMTPEIREVTPRARYSFWLGTGVLPDEQVELENYYDSMRIMDSHCDITPFLLFERLTGM